MVKLLVIDNEHDAIQTLSALLPDGISLRGHGSAALSVDAVREYDPDIVFLSAGLPDASSESVLSAIQGVPIPPPVVLVAETIPASRIARSVRAGAFSYLIKPYVRAEVLEVIDEAVSDVAQRRMIVENLDHPSMTQIVGESPAILRLKQQILRFADRPNPVLITGETGTGKDLVARALHGTSQRANGPYIPINCGAVPATIFESEVFGSQRGAFTGAVLRAGCFEQADHGTLFLDEIGEMDLSSQVKLLRVLEDGYVVRVGGSRHIPIDVRIVAATHLDLRSEIENGRFRADLFYRLNVLTLEIPPLRERPEDIPLLTKIALRQQSDIKTISTPAIRKLLLHSWPGNVRELLNVVARSAALCEGRRITAGDILFM